MRFEVVFIKLGRKVKLVIEARNVAELLMFINETFGSETRRTIVQINQ